MQASVPDEIRCPISFDVMQDPVLADDGHTYERSEITRWLATARVLAPRVQKYPSNEFCTGCV
jgi:hypothetical protein